MLYNKNWDYKLNPVADVLMKGADLLEKHGHTKHVRVGPDGTMCFLGALNAAQGETSMMGPDTPLTKLASEATAKVLGLEHRHDGVEDYRHAVANWNNAPERTGRQVINAMRKAAKSLVAA
jgi:hypothetical protein